MSKWTATQYSDRLGIDLWKFQQYVSLGFIKEIGLNKRYNKLYDSNDMQRLKEKIKDYEESKANFITKYAALQKLKITEKAFYELQAKHFIHIYGVKEKPTDEENQNNKVTYLYSKQEIDMLADKFRHLDNSQYYLEEHCVIKELNITKYTFDWLIENQILKVSHYKNTKKYYSVSDVIKIKKVIELYKEKEFDKC